LTQDIASRGAHVVGSVSLDSAEDVFRTLARGLGDRLRRMPDGETGDRQRFALWQLGVFDRHSDFEPARERRRIRVAVPYQLRPGANAARLRFDDLGYARQAKASYEVFERLRDEGVIPPGVRFQVSLPTPVNTISLVVTERDAAAVAPAYEAALLEEVDEILKAIPAGDLAIQWDAPYEVRVWAGRIPAFMPQPWFDRESLLRSLTRLGDHVPEAAELGYHLCYGDYAHTGNLVFQLKGGPPPGRIRRLADRLINEVARRLVGPTKDAAPMVEIASALTERCRRRIDFIHIPVPATAGDAYLAPLKSVSLKPATELYLGLVHFTDGHAGTARRVGAARRMVRDFGVATECGWGRRDPATIDELMRIHREVSAPVDVEVG
jgi:hypothetical protein